MTQTSDKKSNPQWGYRIEDGKVVSKLFPEGRPASGWSDSPAGMAEKIELATKEAAEKALAEARAREEAAAQAERDRREAERKAAEEAATKEAAAKKAAK